MSEPCKPTGSRKFRGYVLALIVCLVGYLASLYVGHVGQLEPNALFTNLSAFFGVVTPVYGSFAGANAAVHIAGKDPTG